MGRVLLWNTAVLVVTPTPLAVASHALGLAVSAGLGGMIGMWLAGK